MTDNITSREYFAAHCPPEWLKKYAPLTIGDVRDAMIAHRIIPQSAKTLDVMRSYTKADEIKLDAALRFEYADAMVAASKVAK